jgi:hypothetical protein
MKVRSPFKDPLDMIDAAGPSWLRDLQETVARNARERAERERLEQTAPRLVVTMVHGTWARNAAWVDPASQFGTGLRDSLAPALVVPFRWSGRNSVKARSRAVSELRVHIEDIRLRYPDARHALIAHSHGGNVVLSALADPQLARETLGVATLGTPFLSATLRDMDSLFGPMDGVVASGFAGIAVFAVGAALGHGRTWWLHGLLTFAGVAVTLLAASYLTTRMRKHAERICTMMPATSLTQDQLAIVRTSADEALAALSGARVAGGFASIFWSMMAGRVVEKLKDMLQAVDYFGMRELQRQVTKSSDLDDSPRRVGREPSPLAMGNADLLKKSLRESVLPYFPVLVLTLLDDGNAWARWVGAVLAVGYGLPALGALVVSVVSIPFSMIFSLGFLPCGWTLPFAGPHLDLTAEPAPPGTWSVTQVRAGGEGSLSHGRSHDDWAAISFVSEWLKARLAASERANSASV